MVLSQKRMIFAHIYAPGHIQLECGGIDAHQVCIRLYQSYGGDSEGVL
jgi:hypothetical protein